MSFNKLFRAGLLISILVGGALGILSPAPVAVAGTTSTGQGWFNFLPPTYPFNSDSVLSNGWPTYTGTSNYGLDWADRNSSTHKAYFRGWGYYNSAEATKIGSATVSRGTWLSCQNSTRVRLYSPYGVYVGTLWLVHTINPNNSSYDLYGWNQIPLYVHDYAVADVLQDYTNDTCTNTGPHVHEHHEQSDGGLTGPGSWSTNSAYPSGDVPYPYPTYRNSLETNWTRQVNWWWG